MSRELTEEQIAQYKAIVLPLVDTTRKLNDELRRISAEIEEVDMRALHYKKAFEDGIDPLVAKLAYEGGEA